METLKLYIELCWFRHNPAELPRSTTLFKKNLLFSYVLEYFMQANMTDDPFESFYEVSIETALKLLFFASMLFLNKSMYAYLQVTTAILVCANVISLFIVPVVVWLTVSEDALSYYVLSLLLVWDFAVVAYIISKTINVTILASLAVTFFYFTFAYFGAFSLGQLI